MDTLGDGGPGDSGEKVLVDGEAGEFRSLHLIGTYPDLGLGAGTVANSTDGSHHNVVHTGLQTIEGGGHGLARLSVGCGHVAVQVDRILQGTQQRITVHSGARHGEVQHERVGVVGGQRGYEVAYGCRSIGGCIGSHRLQVLNLVHRVEGENLCGGGGLGVHLIQSGVHTIEESPVHGTCGGIDSGRLQVCGQSTGVAHEGLCTVAEVNLVEVAIAVNAEEAALTVDSAGQIVLVGRANHGLGGIQIVVAGDGVGITFLIVEDTVRQAGVGVIGCNRCQVGNVDFGVFQGHLLACLQVVALAEHEHHAQELDVIVYIELVVDNGTAIKAAKVVVQNHRGNVGGSLRHNGVDTKGCGLCGP